eukprot:6203333-Pleurochrysis_carterae.AAC.2
MREKAAISCFFSSQASHARTAAGRPWRLGLSITGTAGTRSAERMESASANVALRGTCDAAYIGSGESSMGLNLLVPRHARGDQRSTQAVARATRSALAPTPLRPRVLRHSGRGHGTTRPSLAAREKWPHKPPKTVGTVHTVRSCWQCGSTASFTLTENRAACCANTHTQGEPVRKLVGQGGESRIESEHEATARRKLRRARLIAMKRSEGGAGAKLITGR